MTKVVTEILKARGYEAKEQEVIRGGVKLNGITIMLDGTVGITVYPEKMGGTADEVVERIITIYEKERNKAPHFNLEGIKDWSWAKDKLKVCLRPVVANSGHITRSFYDMEMVVRVQINSDMSAVVSKNLALEWGKSDEEIFEQAIANDDCFTISNIAELMAELEPEMEWFFREFFKVPMYVVTNEERLHGASAILHKDVLDQVANEVGAEEIYVIPSSIHELIVIPADASKESVNVMLRKVNKEIREDEVLSDHVYTYNTITRNIRY